jgi:hypothetical protein
MNRHNFDIHAEIAQFEFHQPRHRLERLRGVARFARRRIVEQ